MPPRRADSVGATTGGGRASLREEVLMSDITLDTTQLPWEESTSYAEGAQLKSLREKGLERSILLRLPAGFRMEAHSHTGCEQHYVLEGSYEVGDEVYGPGTYRYIPPHTDHGPFSSREGAVLFVVWES
jgi:quercetin dioxygenase-like cupin family protein